MKIKWLVLIIYTILIFVPPIIHGSSYPNNGMDTYYHLQRVQAIEDGISQNLVYYGDYIVGYPLILLNKIGIPLSVSFMWFNYLMLWLVGISIYALVSFLFGNNTGLVALCMMFAAPSIWNLYDTGAIYDLMTVGIVLPLALISFVKVCHKQWTHILWLTALMVFGILIHSVGIVRILPSVSDGNIVKEPSVSTTNFLLILGVPIMLFGSFLMGYFAREFKKISLERNVIIVCVSLIGLIAIFIPLSVFKVTGFAVRFGIDMAIMVSILVICLMGLFLHVEHNKQVDYLTWATTLTAGIPVIITYWR